MSSVHSMVHHWALRVVPLVTSAEAPIESLMGYIFPMGGGPFEMVLIFRVAAPLRFSKGRRVWFILRHSIRALRETSKRQLQQLLRDCGRFCNCKGIRLQQSSTSEPQTIQQESLRIYRIP
jgi:hypothetical protein